MYFQGAKLTENTITEDGPKGKKWQIYDIFWYIFPSMYQFFPAGEDALGQLHGKDDSEDYADDNLRGNKSR